MQTMAEQGLSRARIVRLLAWYDVHARALPWRVKGARADSYRVWLSEIMLQQTTVTAVRGYFLKFVARWPTVDALAAAPLDDVLKAWAGLGYYARARNLHACARDVMENHQGKFPASFDALMKLPGVGPYTAGAIAAIAFDLPCAAVDGNVERVLSRFHAIEEPLPDSKPLLRELASALIPPARAGDMVQALMDLGATICTPKSPNCLICPWTEDCAGRKSGIAATLPRKAARKKLPTRKGYAYWVTREDGAVLLRRRAEKGLLGGMTEVPGSEWIAVLSVTMQAEAPLHATWRKLPGIVEHTFTHFHLEVTVLVAKVGDVAAPEQCRWVGPDDVDGEALPSVMRKIVNKIRDTIPPPLVGSLHKAFEMESNSVQTKSKSESNVAFVLPSPHYANFPLVGEVDRGRAARRRGTA